MLQMVRCIKFGEVLLDKNRSPFMLCQNCNLDFVDLLEFRKHLETCNGLENFFRRNAALIFDSTKGRQLFGRTATGEYKEYRVYEPCEVQNIEAVEQTAIIVKENYIDLIEEELMDPRWYTDFNQQSTAILTTDTSEKVLAYNELVEAVTPYVQFKENLKSNSTTTTKQSSTPMVAGKQSKGVVQRNAAIRHVIPQHTKKTVGVNNTITPTTVAGNKQSPPVTTFILSLDPVANNDVVQLHQPQSVLSIPISNVNTNAEAEYATKKVIMKPKPCQTIKTISMANPVPVPPLARISLPPSNAVNKVYIPKSSPVVQSTVRRVAQPSQSPQQLPQLAQQARPPQLATRTMPKQMPAPVKRATAAIPTKKANGAVPNGHSHSHTTTATTTTSSTATPIHSLPVPALVPVQPPPPPPPALAAPKTKQTEQILNKLATLGLQVKRTNSGVAEHKQATATNTTKTDELVKKLRSKGMNVKLLNKSGDRAKVSGVAVPAKRAKLDVTINAESDPVGVAAVMPVQSPNSKSNLSKNIIIRKVI